MGNLDRENKQKNARFARGIYGQYRFKNTYMGNLERENKQ